MLGVRCASRKKNKKAVCWLRFQVFHSRPGETQRNKYSDIHSEVRGQRVCRHRSVYTHTHAEICTQTHNDSGSLYSVGLDTDTEPTPTRRQGFLSGRSVRLSAAVLASRSCLSGGPAPLSPPLSPPSLSGSITLHHPPELQAPGHPSQPASLPGVRYLRQARVSGSGTSDPDPMNAFLQTWRQLQPFKVQ